MTMKMEMTHYNESWSHEYVKEVCQFLSDYATAMLSAGATTSRIERCVARISRKYMVEVDMSILPTRILLTVWDSEHSHNYSQVGKTHSNGINLNTTTQLSLLSHKIEDWIPSAECKDMEEGLLSNVKESAGELKKILDIPRINKHIVIFLTAVANLSFCRLFNGDYIAMGIVFANTAVGFYYKNLLLSWHINQHIVTIIASIISALIGSSGFIFGISNTPNIALATSVLWLVPGIRFINAMSDILRGHYLVAHSRLTDALITTICLSVGLCLALIIFQIEWR